MEGGKPPFMGRLQGGTTMKIEVKDVDADEWFCLIDGLADVPDLTQKQVDEINSVLWHKDVPWEIVS